MRYVCLPGNGRVPMFLPILMYYDTKKCVFQARASYYILIKAIAAKWAESC